MGHVVVDGRTPVVLESVLQLRRSGVDVRTGWHAGDAAELALAVGAPPPALVVIGREVTPGASSASPWQSRGVAHLAVEEQGGGLVVGPLVLPGRSACLRCVLSARRGVPTVPGVDRTGPSVVVLGAAVVTVTALAVLRGDESLAGISTEIGPGATTVTHRLWPALPSCRCASGRMAG